MSETECNWAGGWCGGWIPKGTCATPCNASGTCFDGCGESITCTAPCQNVTVSLGFWNGSAWVSNYTLSSGTSVQILPQTSGSPVTSLSESTGRWSKPNTGGPVYTVDVTGWPVGTYTFTVGTGGSSGGINYCSKTATASLTIACINTRPGAVNLLSPGNGATRQPLNLSLVVDHPASYVWGIACSPATQTNTLTFYLGGVAKCTNVAVPANSNTISASCAISGLSYDTLYSWYVVAQNGNGIPATSPTWTFRTIAFPAWWQATEGDIFAAGTVQSQIPTTCTGTCKAYIELD